jgi:ABC-type transporter Mla subunit MlaD
MSRERNALKAGIFIVISVLLIVVVVFSIRGLGYIIEPTQTRIVRFQLTDDIGGLSVGDDVRVGGYRVGMVRSIDIVEHEPEQDPVILVRISLPQKLVLRETASVRVQETLTGLSWLNFESLGTGDRLPVEEPLAGRSSPTTELFAGLGEVIPSLREVAVDIRTQTLPQVNQTIERVQQTVDSFGEAANEGTQLIQQVRGHVDPAMEKYHTVADRGAETLVEVRDVLGDSGGDLRQTAANLNSATGTLSEGLPGLIEQVDEFLTKLDSTIEGINGSMEDIAATAENTRELTGAARGVLVRNRARIDSITAALRTTSQNLRGASSEIRRAPWRLFYRPRPGEMQNINIFESARQFSEGAGELHDAAQALRAALEDPAVDEESLEELLQHVQQTFDNFREVEQRLWTEVRN